MSKHMSLEMSHLSESPFKRWWNSRNYLQKRMIRMCLSMLVMVLCFPLYYLGFFGTVEGPLSPSQIGDSLATMGVTRTHCMVIFLSFLIISVSWNWIYNLVSILMGSRLSCSRVSVSSKPCGARVTRQKILDRKRGRKKIQYTCQKGHRRDEAHFHPVKKGAVSHSLWLISLCFCVIVFFMS